MRIDDFMGERVDIEEIDDAHLNTVKREYERWLYRYGPQWFLGPAEHYIENYREILREQAWRRSAA